MNDQVKIIVKIKIDDFYFCFQKNKKISTIIQNTELISLIKQKLGIGSEIKIDFQFEPKTEYNELIGDWFKKSNTPSILVNLRAKVPQDQAQVSMQMFNANVLHAFEQSRNNYISNILDTKLDDFKKENAQFISEIKKENAQFISEIKKDNAQITQKMETENQSLKTEIRNLLGFINIHPLLDYVRKFRTKLMECIANENNISPDDCKDWSTFYSFLGRTHQRQLIEAKVSDFGLDDNDWSALQICSYEVNKIKHPQPRLTRDQALDKLGTLKGTIYEDASGPLLKLIDIFEQNQWQ